MKGPFDYVFGPSTGRPRVFNPFKKRKSKLLRRVEARERKIVEVGRRLHCSRAVAAKLVRLSGPTAALGKEKKRSPRP